MPSATPDHLPRRRDRAELLEDIYRRGDRRRLVRRAATAGGGAGVMAALIAAVLVVRGSMLGPAPGGEEVATRPPAVPSTTVPPQSPPPDQAVPQAGEATSVSNSGSSSQATGGAGGAVSAVNTPGAATGGSASGAVVTGPTTTVLAPDPEPEPAAEPVRGGQDSPPSNTSQASALTPPGCRNSSNPDCGAFRWDPEPGPNGPLSIDVTATPRAGDPRTIDFAVVYTDPDATIDPSCRIIDFGDGTASQVNGGAAGCAVFACMAAYGPWTPPPPEAGRSEASTSHTYTAPGTYTVQFTARSDYGCYEPYSSHGDKTVTVVVP